MKNENILFLTGHRKCGTTMFSNLFDGHPALSVYPSDLCLLYAYYPYYADGTKSTTELLDRLDTVLFSDLRRLVDNNNLSSLFDLNKFKQEFLSSLDHSQLNDVSHVISCQLKAYQKAVGDDSRNFTWTVAKETSIDIYAHEIFEWFPNAKFIQLIRDPRDNYASLKSGVDKHYSLFGESEKMLLASLLHRALLDMKMAAMNQERFGEDRYMYLRFEDLVSQPQRCMENVANFLNIEFDKSLMTPTLLGQPVPGNNFEGEAFFQISGKNSGRWPERISSEEGKIIEFHFSELMRKFDYELKFTESERMDAASEFYKWSNYTYYFRDSFAVLK